jgi:hypothetical protein
MNYLSLVTQKTVGLQHDEERGEIIQSKLVGVALIPDLRNFHQTPRIEPVSKTLHRYTTIQHHITT